MGVQSTLFRVRSTEGFAGFGGFSVQIRERLCVFYALALHAGLLGEAGVMAQKVGGIIRETKDRGGSESVSLRLVAIELLLKAGKLVSCDSIHLGSLVKIHRIRPSLGRLS